MQFLIFLLVIDWTLVGAVAAVIAVFAPLLSKSLSGVTALWDRRSGTKRIGAESHAGLLSSEDSSRYFVQPKCRYVAPPGGSVPSIAEGTPQLFDILDYMLEHPENYKYLILLAESGMGKTTALLHYYVRHTRRLRKPEFELRLIPLSDPNSESQIADIAGKANTVLMLDAFDENIMALVDHIECLQLIVKATSRFRCVLITCRTQFFPKDEEIPEETGIPIVGARGAGQKPEYSLHKIYLLPFDNEQVKKYLRLRYPFRRQKRKQVLKIIMTIPQLTARPLLLNYTDYLVRAKTTFEYTYELYEEMVKGWLVREAKEPSSLRQFSEQLAVYLYLNREERKSEKISEDELLHLAKEWQIDIEDWELSGRSLLNRDPAGDLKFADSSIMEHLFVCQFLLGDARTLQTTWTDQMHLFLWERFMQQWKETDYPRFAPEPFKLLLEHPKGIDTLIKSHTVYAQRSKEHFPLEDWDRFGASVIANLLHISNHAKPIVKFMRIEEDSYSDNFGERRIKFNFSSCAWCQCSEGKLHHNTYAPDKKFTVPDYQGEFSAVQLTDGEAAKELPREVANCFFDIKDHWIRRAFRIRTDSGQDVILAFQTITPVDSELINKITRCASVLF
jgi:hypothetical protein